jgi:hypothetical protein
MNSASSLGPQWARARVLDAIADLGSGFVSATSPPRTFGELMTPVALKGED